jgi:8-oxo-dGTP pyrophosphatase MutT (NUDIX family)
MTMIGQFSTPTFRRDTRRLNEARAALGVQMSNDFWSVIHSRYVLRDRWLTIRADNCVTSRGVTLAPYYVIERPDFVAILAIDLEDQVLLVRQYRHGVRAMSLELPGGVFDCGENDPIAAARRELGEETGYRGGEFRLLVSLGVQPASATNFAHVVLATGVEAGSPAPDEGEDIELVRVSRNQARTLALEGAIINANHVGFLLLALARLEESS